MIRREVVFSSVELQRTSKERLEGSVLFEGQRQ